MDVETAKRLVAFLSHEELEGLIDRTGAEFQSIELHQEILAFGCELMKVITIVEVALRNTVAANLTQHFRAADWLQRSLGQFRWRPHERSRIRTAIKQAKRAAYAKLSQAEKSDLDRRASPDGWHPETPHVAKVKSRQELIPATDGQVIAELALGFWKGLYGEKCQHALWRPTLKRTFPNREVSRSAVASLLEMVYQSRNRLAHHEPVLHKRFRETVGAIEFVIRELGTLPEEDEGPRSLLLRDDLYSGGPSSPARFAPASRVASAGGSTRRLNSETASGIPRARTRAAAIAGSHLSSEKVS